LPAREPKFSYTGVHDLLKLAAIRARPVLKEKKAITIALMGSGIGPIFQNTLYTMIKYGKVNNYIIGFYDKKGKEACLDMNLPCFDGRPFAPLPLDDSLDELPFGSLEFRIITFIRPILILELLNAGYAVHITDTDVSYAPHNVWESWLLFLNLGNADAGFFSEGGGDAGVVNVGNGVLLPTWRCKKLVKQWADAAVESINNNGNEQRALNDLHESAFDICMDAEECRNRWNLAQKAVVRVFPWPW
jgi:hypothetical protein